MIQEVHMNPTGAIVKDIAEIARPAVEDGERIGAKQRETTDEKAERRAGRAAQGRHRRSLECWFRFYKVLKFHAFGLASL
jgi:hypothetical protein